MTNLDPLQARAKALRLHGLLAHWPEAVAAGWVQPLIDWEEQERARRSLERRLNDAHIGRFKAVCDFDWTWPKRCDRATFEALMTLDFLKDATNVVLVGPNGVGKTTLARNLAYQALIHGHTVLFATAGQLLGDLAALDSDSALRRRLRHRADAGYDLALGQMPVTHNTLVARLGLKIGISRHEVSDFHLDSLREQGMRSVA